MPTQLQFRRGTTAQNNAFTGAAGEISIDTTIDTARVHDGSTAGGFELIQNSATQTLTNKTLTSPTINSATIAMGTNKITGMGDPTSAQDAATKAYVDAQVTAQDLDFQADSGGALAIDLDSESLTFTGGTGIDTSGSGNAVTFAIDSTVATLAGTQTLTNKTLTSPQINTQIDMLARAELRFQDATGGQYVGLEAPATVTSSFVFTLPSADGTSGQALVTDGSGALSFSAAGATVTSDESTNTDFLLYFASTTTGALTAVKQDSGLIYNPSTGTLSSSAFSFASGTMTGDIAMGTNKITGMGDPTSAQDAATKAYVDGELSSLSSNSLTQGDTNWTITDSGTGSIVATVDNTTHSTFAAAGITLSQGNFVGDLTGNADTASAWQTARTLSLTGAVTGSASIDGSGNVSLATTNTADPVITLTGAVTGSGTMTNLGSVSITTTATADPTLTLAGDASGSATFTNLGNATLTVTVADDSHNHVTSNIDGLAEFISDTVGAMVTSNTESGISVTYDDTDNTLDFNVNDPTITLTGAVTGSATMTNLGNVSIATTATNDPTITLAGDLSGSATLTNLGNATLTATIVANSVALGTDTTGNYVGAGATSGNGISGSVSSEGGTFTVTSNATNANTGSTIVFRDGSGNFSAGVITATTTTARYADLAEKYTSDADYDPGTVLVFGGDEEVTECTTKYNKRIAGIISTDPAYLMNSEGSGVTVALLGRVPCKVIGEIRKGDLMVSSDIPGHAQAWRDESNPPAGSIIGKALENKTGAGADIIEVVVGRI